MREVLKLLSRACDHYHKHRELAPQDMWVPHYLAIKKFMTFKFVHVFSITDVPTSLRYWVALEKPEAGGRSRYTWYPVMLSTHHAAGNTHRRDRGWAGPPTATGTQRTVPPAR